MKDARYRFTFDPRDTPAQRRVLRSGHKPSMRARNMFPAGTRVTTRPFGSSEPHPNGERGSVVRHVPGTNAQGGYVVVVWDSTGREGRVGPGSIIPIPADVGCSP